jgi:hypothetical protein
MSAPTATATRGRTLFRSAAVAGFIAFAFDPDDGKDQDGPHAFAWRTIHGWARPPRRRIRRKFNDGAHVELSSDCRSDPVRPTTAIIKIRTWLTAS